MASGHGGCLLDEGSDSTDLEACLDRNNARSPRCMTRRRCRFAPCSRSLQADDLAAACVEGLEGSRRTRPSRRRRMLSRRSVEASNHADHWPTGAGVQGRLTLTVRPGTRADPRPRSATRPGSRQFATSFGVGWGIHSRKKPFDIEFRQLVRNNMIQGLVPTRWIGWCKVRRLRHRIQRPRRHDPARRIACPYPVHRGSIGSPSSAVKDVEHLGTGRDLP